MVRLKLGKNTKTDTVATWIVPNSPFDDLERWVKRFEPIPFTPWELPVLPDKGAYQTFQTSVSEILPQYSLYVNKDQYVVSMDVPGVKPEDIDIQCLENKILTITYARNNTKFEGYTVLQGGKAKNGTVSVTLPKAVSFDDATAEVVEGVLYVYLPVKEPSKKKIQVKGY